MVSIGGILILCLIILIISIAAVVAGVILIHRGMKAIGYGISCAGVSLAVIIVAIGVWACISQHRANSMRRY